jgi:nucleotide-binding universal stress UspA family protein
VKPWSTIVVGTDGSDTAARAVGHAAELAAATDATLVVVTAYQDGGARSPGAAAAPDDVQWALTAGAGAEKLARAGAERAAGAGARSVRTRTLRGEPTTVLLQVAADTDAGLIVVGSKGMSSASRFVTGSVPNSLSHHADRDVLIVHTD